MLKLIDHGQLWNFEVEWKMNKKVDKGLVWKDGDGGSVSLVCGYKRGELNLCGWTGWVSGWTEGHSESQEGKNDRKGRFRIYEITLVKQEGFWGLMRGLVSRGQVYPSILPVIIIIFKKRKKKMNKMRFPKIGNYASIMIFPIREWDMFKNCHRLENNDYDDIHIS